MTPKKPTKINPIWQIPLAFTLFLFGFLLTTQYRTQVAISGTLEGQSLDNLSALVVSLGERRDALFADYLELEQDYNEMLENAALGNSLLTGMERQLQQMRLFAGEVDIRGAGIIITIERTPQLMSYDIIDIVNELFVSGAVAVAVNDIRVNGRTQIEESYGLSYYSDITINDEALSFPIIIKAVGKADTLEKGMLFSGGIINNLNRLYNIFPQIEKANSVIIPANKSVNYKYTVKRTTI